MRRIAYVLGGNDRDEYTMSAKRDLDGLGVRFDDVVYEVDVAKPFLHRSGAKSIIHQVADDEIVLYCHLTDLADRPSSILKVVDHLHALALSIVAVDYSSEPVAASLAQLKAAVRAFAGTEKALDDAQDHLDRITEYTADELDRRVRAAWKAFEALYEGGPNAILALLTRPPIDVKKANGAEKADLPEVAAVLEKARAARGLSYDAVAELIGRSKGATHRAFKSGSGPTAQRLMHELIVKPRMEAANDGEEGSG